MSSNEMHVELDEWRGYSAYEVAVRNGYRGTEEEWLNSLKGRDGGVATVNGVAHDANGNVAIEGDKIQISKADSRTLKEIADEADVLSRAMRVTGDAIDVGGKYIDNARFR